MTTTRRRSRVMALLLLALAVAAVTAGVAGYDWRAGAITGGVLVGALALLAVDVG